MVDFWDPEIELWLPSGMIQAGGTYRGREAVLGWMKEWAEAWEEIEYTPEEFTALMQAEAAKYAKLIQKLGISAD